MRAYDHPIWRSAIRPAVMALDAQPVGLDVATLREALYNCGLAAHNGGLLMDRKQRGGRDKLRYIERTASAALASEPQP